MAITVEEVRTAIEEIRARQNMPETGHQREDVLYRKVLRTIVELGGPGADLAAAALESRKIDFVRWCVEPQ